MIVDMVNKLYASNQPLYNVTLTVEVLQVGMQFKHDNIRASTTDTTDVELIKGYAFYNKQNKVGFQLMLAVPKNLEVQQGSIMTFEGTLYNYDGIPCLGREEVKPTRRLKASKHSNTINTKPDFNLPIPIFTFYEDNITVLPIESYPPSWNLHRLNLNLEGKSITEYLQREELKHQEGFTQLVDYIQYPVIQIINGSTTKDVISEGVLNYLTDNEWRQVYSILDLRGYNKGPKIIFCKDELVTNPDFPIINML